ncbi:hypothetical protein O6H91_09G080400 [Diphasiastrum complanatum]|uniref:Uncharacterized protein n=8 Tax=Diphasiastrum complanatum TaxID=34168 RepID=A0ACC2CR46_DIPCM|nr:hypothetical protein O6H91_09G080400 [Diphasiastrum complanatum]KAJ7544469.1 hypothetical protein O6H91_09G080400 [Diphasiastrum complanatum]KAJ7544470.1 hypothetical protein O6H91_09G080400 [Diphasiastrum complanatum]KAJ7544471.1 hypothetical protein O6H91_09G080400 [Diphasiastrum complanatum]KAJ7544473.1 hypothetical protein O6H91_09G080400 [Diphasiastrum complanatum]
MAQDVAHSDNIHNMEVQQGPPDSKERDKLTKSDDHKDFKKYTVPFYKLFSFADPLDILLMIIGTIGAMVNGLSMPIMTLIFGQITNAFGQNSTNVHETAHKVTQVAVKFVYLGIAASVASFCEVSFWMCTGERQAARIRSLYLQAILRQDITFFDVETNTGEVVGRMSGDTILIQEAIGEKVGTFVQLMTTFVSGFTIAFIKGWKLTLVLLSAMPLLIITGGSMAYMISKMSSEGQEAYAEAGTLVEQVVSGIRTVSSFTGEKKAVNAYDKALQKAYKAGVKQGLASGLGLGGVLCIMFCTYGLALWYGSKLIVNQGYSGGSVISVIFAVLMGGMSMGQASPSLSAFAAGQAAAYKMFEVIHRTPSIDIYNLKGEVLEDLSGDIEFRNVDFTYPARPDVPIFRGFCLTIPAGITAALVGESGSGKSTVIGLIERFYDPQRGEVLVDGLDIKKMQLKWLRQQVGLVSQEPVLFGASIKENIAYGKEGATLEEIRTASELANAAKFINKLPQGFDTQVGEHGTQLSGGQKQRVAIARAILKNPRILLLDEATSALDAESERVVQEALDRIMVNRTTVVVAHRLSTIKNADTIAVVQRGVIVEKGTHSALLENPSGAYSQLVRLQALHQTEQITNDQIDPDSIDPSPAAGSFSRGNSRNSSGRRSFGRSFSLRRSHSAFSYNGLDDTVNKDGRRSSRQRISFQVENQNDPEQGHSADIKDPSIFRLATLNKPETPIFVLGSLAAGVNGIIFPMFGLLLSSVIGTFYDSNHHKLRKDANFWSAMFVALAGVCFIVAPSQMYCFGIVGHRLIRRIRHLTFDKVVRQEIGWFDEPENSSGAISARLSADAAQVRSMVGDTLSLVVQNLATIVAGLIIAFSATWQLALLILAIVPLLGLQGFMQMKAMKGFSADAKVAYEEASHVASDAVGSIRTVASFCAEKKVIALYEEKCKSSLKSGIRQGMISGTGLGAANFVTFASNALSFWYGARLVEQHKTTFKMVFRVFFAITLSALGVSQSAGLAPDLTKVKAAVRSVFTILDRNSKIDPTNPEGVTLPAVKGDIEFQHVSFKYPTRPDVQIFRDLCLFVHAGKTVALVGESGSGKSTVVSMLERFYDPDSGQIFIDEVEIRKFQLRWLRQQIGLVSQEPVLFSGTIRSNIAYGKDGLLTDDEIQAAAQAANAAKFISSLPHGYDTEVGERGIQLSGGQKQRIAIARAIVKDPKILLLDEATSALDAESEHVVQEALDRVMVNRTTIVIAHRLSTIVNADVIAVVKNGIIAEKGRHKDLLNIEGGAYASLVKLHFASKS